MQIPCRFRGHFSKCMIVRLAVLVLRISHLQTCEATTAGLLPSSAGTPLFSNSALALLGDINHHKEPQAILFQLDNCTVCSNALPSIKGFPADIAQNEMGRTWHVYQNAIEPPALSSGSNYSNSMKSLGAIRPKSLDPLSPKARMVEDVNFEFTQLNGFTITTTTTTSSLSEKPVAQLPARTLQAIKDNDKARALFFRLIATDGSSQENEGVSRPRELQPVTFQLKDRASDKMLSQPRSAQQKPLVSSLRALL